MLQYVLATKSLLPGVQNNVGAAAIAIGVLTLIWLLVLRPAKERKRGKRDPLAKPVTQARQERSLAAERAAERQMESLVIELEALSRRMGGELDAKSAKLESLIEQANIATERLEAAKGRSTSQQAATLVDAVVAGKSGPAESGLAGISAHRDVYALADAGESAEVIARKVNRPAGEVELILALREQ